jgi:hypothetical protein
LQLGKVIAVSANQSDYYAPWVKRGVNDTKSQNALTAVQGPYIFFLINICGCWLCLFVIWVFHLLFHLSAIWSAYANLRDYYAGPYLSLARDSIGLSQLPNGTAFYQERIWLFTTTNYTAAEIHSIGLSEVDRITKEMEAIALKYAPKLLSCLLWYELKTNPFLFQILLLLAFL